MPLKLSEFAHTTGTIEVHHFLDIRTPTELSVRRRPRLRLGLRVRVCCLFSLRTSGSIAPWQGQHNTVTASSPTFRPSVDGLQHQ